MVCDQRGTNVEIEARFCPACGQLLGTPAAPGAPVVQQGEAASGPPAGAPLAAQHQTWAIWSLVLGILSLTLCPTGTAPFAIWTGVRSMRRGEKSGLATAGIVLGALGCVWMLLIMASIVLPRLLVQDRQAREVALRGTLHDMRISIALFCAHTGCYPEKLSDLTRDASNPPAQGVSVWDGERNAAERNAAINAADWQGPYLDTPDGQLPSDPITGHADWVYVNSGGEVHSAATGSGLDGTQYSTW